MEGVTESQELRLLRHAFTINPGSDAFVPLAQHLCDIGRPEEAEQICRRGLAFMPADHRGHMLLARALCDRGRLKEAQDVLSELAKHRTEDPEVWVQLGGVVVRRGERARARALLDYAQSLGASGTAFEAARTMARTPAKPNQPTPPPLRLGERVSSAVPDDRPKPVAGVLFSKTAAAPGEHTVVVSRRRALTRALAAGVLACVGAFAWLLLRG